MSRAHHLVPLVLFAGRCSRGGGGGSDNHPRMALSLLSTIASPRPSPRPAALALPPPARRSTPEPSRRGARSSSTGRACPLLYLPCSRDPRGNYRATHREIAALLR